MPQDALADLRVLDFAQVIAGPLAARMFADFGADVIKIEPPEGEEMRRRAPLRDGHSTYFGQVNAGKRSLALDLKRPEAVELVRRLARNSDVVIESFRPGVMQRLGLDYTTLAAINPRLVYCSISGYGQTGPKAERAAYAMLVHAESGFDRTLAHYAGRERPAPQAVFVADVVASAFAFGAIQTALRRRDRTGSGEHVDLALYDSMLNLLIYEMQEAQFPQTTPRVAYGPVRAADGELLITPFTERNFQALASVTGIAADDPRFADSPSRVKNWRAMMALVEAWTSGRTIEECRHALDAAGVPSARYNEPGDAYSDAHARSRGVFTQVHDGGGPFTAINVPWRTGADPVPVGARVPRIGEHTGPILRALALTPAEIEQLARSGTFGPGFDPTCGADKV